jgi:hypothetical protein
MTIAQQIEQECIDTGRSVSEIALDHSCKIEKLANGHTLTFVDRSTLFIQQGRPQSVFDIHIPVNATLSVLEQRH